jgi:hypothetical protein
LTNCRTTSCSARSTTILDLHFWETRARHRLSADSQRIISGHVEYFRNHRHLLRYATSLRHGCPIGGGPTKGACKSVVTMRFKRSGQR